MAHDSPPDEPRQAPSSHLETGLIDLLPSAAFVYQAESCSVLHCNQHGKSLWGWPAKLDAAVLALVNGVLQSGEPVHDQEIQLVAPQGRSVAAAINVEPLLEEQGRVVGAFGLIVRRGAFASEMERQRKYEEVHLDRDLLMEAFARAPVFLAVLRGPDHVFERVNERYRQLTGGRDLIGRPAPEVLPELESQGHFQLLDRVFRTGLPFSATNMPVLFRNEAEETERELRMDFVYEPLRDEAGATTGIVAVGIDLTEHRRAQDELSELTAQSERWRRLYETVLSNTPDFVYVFGLDHRFTYANRALLDMWGQTWDEAIGHNCLELGYEPWHAELHDREIEQVIATRAPVRGEVPFTGTTGTRVYDYIFVPVIGQNGEVEAVAGTTRDVTGRKQLEQDLKARADDLARADRMKDEFIALLAHELRNPLAPIRNGLQLLGHSITDAKLRPVLGMMDRQLQHMVRLIDDLLDVSRISRRKLRLQKKRVQLNDVINSALEITRPAIEAAGHQLNVSLPPEPVMLEADPTRLAQVFGNLLSNSAKYTDPGGCIQLIAERAENKVVIVVADTGIGIEPADLPNLFNMFTQIHSDEERSGGGLGIGLALVKSLVNLHEGQVWAESEGHNRGSRFIVQLPVLQVAAPPAPDMPVAARPDAPLRRILVVDDNRDACDSMAMLLEMLGNEVRRAYDGLEAVDVAEQFKPDLILMDVGMPKMDGCEAAERIRQQSWSCRTTLIAVTGWGQDKDRSRSRDAGFDGHLVKPVSLSDLEQTLTLVRARASEGG